MTEKDNLEVRIEFIKSEIRLLKQLIETNKKTLEGMEQFIPQDDKCEYYKGKIFAYRNVVDHLYNLLDLYYTLKGEHFNGDIEEH